MRGISWILGRGIEGNWGNLEDKVIYWDWWVWVLVWGIGRVDKFGLIIKVYDSVKNE